MARRKEQRRQSKEQLANSVRKHFNSMGIIENEVVVDFLYKVRWQGESMEYEGLYIGLTDGLLDKNFRMRFAPQRPR
jgi:histone deacetylase complex subunit SAP30